MLFPIHTHWAHLFTLSDGIAVYKFWGKVFWIKWPTKALTDKVRPASPPHMRPSDSRETEVTVHLVNLQSKVPYYQQKVALKKAKKCKN